MVADFGKIAFMKKVFIVHGFEGAPNGSWKSWLMVELDKKNVYAFSLAMPKPEKPIAKEWVDEIARYFEQGKNDEIYLVGHSLGVPAILLYLEKAKRTIAGAVLVSGPIEKNANRKIDDFLRRPFNFRKIKSNCKKFTIIHGDNDPYVPVQNARDLAKAVGGDLIIVKNGQHLNGSAGYFTLPECLEVLMRAMKL